MSENQFSSFLHNPWPIAVQPQTFHNHCKNLQNLNEEEAQQKLTRVQIDETLAKVDELLGKTSFNRHQSDTTINTFQLPEFKLTKKNVQNYIIPEMNDKQEKLYKATLSLEKQIKKQKFNESNNLQERIDSLIKIQPATKSRNKQLEAFFENKLKSPIDVVEYRKLILLYTIFYPAEKNCSLRLPPVLKKPSN